MAFYNGSLGFFPAPKYDPVTFPQSTVLTICCLDVVAVPPSRLHLQKLHGPVQQAVNHLKARVLVVVNGRQAPAVPRTHIWFVDTGNDSVGNTETGLNHTTLIKFKVNASTTLPHK